MSTQLLLGAAGALVGSAFGMPQAGWLAGVMMASVLDPMVIRQQGPRLDDVKIQTSTWGKRIPTVYGSARVAGNVIWSSDIHETSHTESGGKGGPQTEATTYTYSVNVAVSICTGPVFGIRKIWANGKIIYTAEVSATATAILASRSNHLRIYTGTDTQLPDPTIEAALGVGNVPAYRGQVVVVFNELPLAEFGNRLPNFEFEVVQSGSEVGYRTLFSTVANEFPLNGNDVFTGIDEGIFRITKEAPNGSAYLWSTDGEYLGPDARNDAEWRLRNAYSDMVDFAPGAVFTLRRDSTRASPIGDPSFPVVYPQKNGVAFWPGAIGADEYFCGICLSADKKIVMLTTIVVKDGVAVQSKWYQFYLNGTLYRSGVVAAIPGSARPEFGWAYNYVFDQLDERAYPAALESDYEHLWIPHVKTNGILVLLRIDPVTHVLAPITTDHLGATSSVSEVYADDGILFRKNFKFFSAVTRLPAIVAQPVPLSTIVLDQCLRCGLTADEVDVTQLTDHVTGYVIANSTDARAALRQLQLAYFFDAVESEGQIKFVKRGAEPVAIISSDELAAHHSEESLPELLSCTRAQEMECPAAVTVRYLNAASDYQVGAETSQRLVTHSKHHITEELAVVMTADHAARIADVLLREAHVGRTTVSFTTARTYAWLEPTDVVQIQTSDTSYRVRLTKKTEAGGLLSFDAVVDDTSIYTSSVLGGSQMAAQVTSPLPGPTRIEFLDMPIVRDTDDDAGLYIAFSGYRRAWTGAHVWRANDGLSYTSVASIDSGCVMGVTTTALAAPTSNTNLPDEASGVIVSLISASSVSLASISFDALLNGGNLAVIGKEIVQFRSATLIDARTYRLGGLLRGRFGTEAFTNNHASGERFVVLDARGMLRVNEGASAIGATRYYKAVSVGNRLVRASAYAITNTAAGLKPWRPVHLKAIRLPNNDWQLSWVRRTRIDGQWRNAVDAALGEASEVYEVEVLTSSNVNASTIKRTMPVTQPNVTYTATMQMADFGSVQALISFRVYQLSATVGRGDAASYL